YCSWVYLWIGCGSLKKSHALHPTFIRGQSHTKVFGSCIFRVSTNWINTCVSDDEIRHPKQSESRDSVYPICDFQAKRYHEKISNRRKHTYRASDGWFWRIGGSGRANCFNGSSHKFEHL